MSGAALRRVSDASAPRLSLTLSNAVARRSFGLGPHRTNPVLCEHYAYTHYFGVRTSEAWYPRYHTWNFPRDLWWFLMFPVIWYVGTGLIHWRQSPLFFWFPYLSQLPKGDIANIPGNYADFETNPAERKKWLNPVATSTHTKYFGCDADYVPAKPDAAAADAEADEE